MITPISQQPAVQQLDAAAPSRKAPAPPPATQPAQDTVHLSAQARAALSGADPDHDGD